jgi:hypothetical protein
MFETQRPRSSRVKLLLSASALLIAALAATPSQARPDNVTFCRWYSDPGMTQLVGSCVYGCTGITCNGNTSTPYSRCTTGPSCH